MVIVQGAVHVPPVGEKEIPLVEVPNVAVVAALDVSVNTHVPVPEQPPPDHPVNADPPLGVAVRVTAVPEV